MFYDKSGLLIAYVQGSPSELSIVKIPLVSSILSTFGKETLLDGFLSVPEVPSGEIDIFARTVVVPGKYTWSELFKWHSLLTPVFSIPGVEFTDINDEKNILTIGYSDLNSLSQIQRRVIDLGVPIEAVEFEKDSGAVAGATLDDEVSPVYGGLKITWSIGGNTCTHGLNATRNGIRGFITNAHCSSSQFRTDNTLYTQPAYPLSNQIGIEKFDPGYFTSSTSSLCPAGRACRYSDANFVDYQTITPLQGRFYYTENNTPPPHDLSIEGVIATQGEAAGTPIAGSYASKIGQTTGLTTGRVFDICQVRNVGNLFSYDGKPVTYICNHRVAANFYEGDSGSPVLTASQPRKIMGVAWGYGGSLADNTKYFTYSDLNAIRRELGGNLQTGN